MFKKLRQASPIIVLIIMLIISTFYAFMTVYAADGFATKDKNWDRIKNSLASSSDETYPYNATNDITITSVGMDITYGTTRPLVTYIGEVPERETKKDNGDYIDNFAGTYSVGGTSLDCGGTHGEGDACNGVSAFDYWGFDDCTTCQANILPLNDDHNATLAQMQNVNSDSVISLRLYALSNYTSSWFENIIYAIVKFFANFGTMLISVIIGAKNINMEEIMEVLQLDKLITSFKDVFIGKDGQISAFMAFCIIMFIFAVVAYVIRYVKGGQKESSILNLISTALIGLLVIGMSMAGNLTDLGGSLSNVAAELMYATTGSLSDSSQNTANSKVFLTEIEDENNTNKVIQLQEMSFINKAYIELQICAQFNVKGIDKLNLSNLHDSDGTIAKNTLEMIGDGDFEENFGNNLGYYYWFANSSATEKTDLNATYPDTNTVAAKQKLSSMITYLQKCYNAAVEDGDTAAQNRIKDIILAFASPRGSQGIVTILIYTVVLVVLALCLFKYALNVMMSKIGLFLALMGMTIAGPLMVTNNKKLVGTGKHIMGLLVVSFIHITVYSIVFDLILYLVSAVISPDLIDLLVAAVLTILLFYFNPIIQNTLKRALENVERNVAGEYSQNKRAMKNWANTKMRNAVNSYDRKSKIVGYDENGEAIRQNNAGNRLSKLLHQAQNNVFNEGTQRQGILKINAEQNEARRREIANSNSAKRRAAEALVEKTQDKISKSATAYKKQLEFEANERKKDAYAVDEYGTTFNEENLTASELEKKREIDRLINQYNNTHFSKEQEEQDLLNDRSTIEQQLKNAQDTKNSLDNNPEASTKTKVQASMHLAKMQEKYNENQRKLDALAKEREAFDNEQRQRAEKINTNSRNLVAEIDNRVINDTLKANDLDGYSTIDEAAEHTAQNDHKDELSKAINNQITVAAIDANTKQKGKIGAESTVNREAVESLAAAEYQKKQLENNQLVSDKREAVEQSKQIVDAVMRKNNSHAGDAAVTAARMEHDKAWQEHGIKKKVEGHKTALQHTKEAKAADKANKAEGKAIYKEAKKDNGRHASHATISEQINSSMKQLETQSRQIESERASLDRARRDEMRATAAKGDANAFNVNRGATAHPEPTQRQVSPTAARREDYQ